MGWTCIVVGVRRRPARAIDNKTKQMLRNALNTVIGPRATVKGPTLFGRSKTESTLATQIADKATISQAQTLTRVPLPCAFLIED